MIERERESQDSEGPNMMVFALIFKYNLRNVANGLVGRNRGYELLKVFPHAPGFHIYTGVNKN